MCVRHIYLKKCEREKRDEEGLSADKTQRRSHDCCLLFCFITGHGRTSGNSLHFLLWLTTDRFWAVWLRPSCMWKKCLLFFTWLNRHATRQLGPHFRLLFAPPPTPPSVWQKRTRNNRVPSLSQAFWKKQFCATNQQQGETPFFPSNHTFVRSPHLFEEM